MAIQTNNYFEWLEENILNKTGIGSVTRYIVTKGFKDLTDLLNNSKADLVDGKVPLEQLPEIAGPVGPQGPVGPSGSQGIQGITGPSGSQGPIGPSGSQGPVGPSGSQGIQGLTGPSGSQGIQGVPGPSGSQGIQGIQGIQGETGPSGSQGIQGIQGPSGSQGPAGPVERSAIPVASGSDAFTTGGAFDELAKKLNIPTTPSGSYGNLIVKKLDGTWDYLPTGSHGYFLTENTGSAYGVSWEELTATKVNVDSTHRFVTDQQIGIWNDKVDADSLNDKADLDLLFVSAVDDYTLILTNRGKLIKFNVSTAKTLTVPTNASVAFPLGTQIIISQEGTGQVIVAGASGVTINSADGNLKSRVQFSTLTLIKEATNTWLLVGDLTE